MAPTFTKALSLMGGVSFLLLFQICDEVPQVVIVNKNI
jgi:hypothetical protein